MKISIITVCFNSASTIRDTLDSVLGQTYADIEHIIVDGKSTDGTVDIIRQYESRYQGKLRWISEPDGGIYDAMNKGIFLAAGDIIGFLNADDYYQDNGVTRDIGQAFSAHPEIDAIHGNLSYINTNRQIVRTWMGTEYVSGAFQRGWNPAHPTFYCKRSCFDSYGAFDPSIGSAADFELMLRFIERYHICTLHLNRSMVFMRIGGSSTASIKAVLRNTAENQQAFHQNNLRCPWYYPMWRLLVKLRTIKKPLQYFIQH